MKREKDQVIIKRWTYLPLITAEGFSVHTCHVWDVYQGKQQVGGPYASVENARRFHPKARLRTQEEIRDNPKD
jgi:hypothetical protein